ncbi:hypothetical protein PEL8287_00957 [Roseovarius litorisediminis]|uniref:Uncharacterized protein n=1 Tax=Roseovarius litorisediminis TaxID=1312363 RepID=A0A1Y5RT47_9RHOB|nr:hypothetical protein PEL8287_00957 [Roseovarius litorisediminis]
MGRLRKGKWADVPAGHDNPLSYAAVSRDRSVIQMVEDAVRHKQVMLAYQAVVPAGRQGNPLFTRG